MEQKKLVRLEWDADDDSYLMFMDGSAEPVARLYTGELEALEAEIKRVNAEMSA